MRERTEKMGDKEVLERQGLKEILLMEKMVGVLTEAVSVFKGAYLDS